MENIYEATGEIIENIILSQDNYLLTIKLKDNRFIRISSDDPCVMLDIEIGKNITGN